MDSNQRKNTIKQIRIGEDLYDSDLLSEETKKNIATVAMAEAHVRAKILELQILQKGINSMKEELIKSVKSQNKKAAKPL